MFPKSNIKNKLYFKEPGFYPLSLHLISTFSL